MPRVNRRGVSVQKAQQRRLADDAGELPRCLHHGHRAGCLSHVAKELCHWRVGSNRHQPEQIRVLQAQRALMAVKRSAQGVSRYRIQLLGARINDVGEVAVVVFDKFEGRAAAPVRMLGNHSQR